MLVADHHALRRHEPNSTRSYSDGGKGVASSRARGRERVVDPSETVYEPEFHADRVESRVGNLVLPFEKWVIERPVGAQPLREQQPVE